MALKKQDTTSAISSEKLMKFYRESSISRIEDAIATEQPALSLIRKEQGEAVCVSILIRIIADCVGFFNLGKNMNAEQIYETAKLVMKEFYFLKVADLKVFFNRIKAGYYGAMFDRLDGQVIMFNLHKYVDERMDFSEKHTQERSKEFFQQENDEMYLIKIGENWLRSCGNDFEEVAIKEAATPYTYGVAKKLKEWVSKEQDKEVKVWNKNKGEPFFDYLEKHNPELLPKGERFRRATENYYMQKEKILSDKNLSDLEKENAIRTLAGLSPLTVEEYHLQQVAYGIELSKSFTKE